MDYYIDLVCTKKDDLLDHIIWIIRCYYFVWIHFLYPNIMILDLTLNFERWGWKVELLNYKMFHNLILGVEQCYHRLCWGAERLRWGCSSLVPHTSALTLTPASTAPWKPPPKLPELHTSPSFPTPWSPIPIPVPRLFPRASLSLNASLWPPLLPL